MVRSFFVGVTFCVLLLQSCDYFEYSPIQVYSKSTKVAINTKNPELLNCLPQDDTITIAFVGDSQRFYDELDLFIDTVNNIAAVDFVLLAGDISDFGLLAEFELINKIHTHNDGYPYNDGIRYMTTHSFDKKSFVLLKILNGQINYSLTDY